MVEGHHFGADEHREEQRVPWEKKELLSPSTISLDSGNEGLVIKTKGVLTFSDFSLQGQLVSFSYLKPNLITVF